MVSDFACVDQGMSELFFQGLDAPEATAVNSLLGDFCEEPLHRIQPCRTGRCKVNLVPGTSRQPSQKPGGFVSGIVVDGDVSRLPCRLRNGLVYLFKEFHQLLLTKSLMKSSDDMACCHIQRGNQRRRPMTRVGISEAFMSARLHSQTRLCVRSTACTRPFPSTHKTIAFSGGLM